MGKVIDLTGQKFGRWTVLKRSTKKSKAGRCIFWICQCECGTIKEVNGYSLRSGQSESCGCLQKERVSDTCKQRVSDNHPMYGKHHSNKTKKKMSIAHKGQLAGEKNPMYNPNLTDEERVSRRIQQNHKEWSRKVKEQADYTCIICGSKGGNLVSHHLNCYKDFPEQRYDVSNGVCLCESCHKEFHMYMGGTKIPCSEQDFIEWSHERDKE